MHANRVVVGVCCMILALTFLVCSATAQSEFACQYAVKFLCGSYTGKALARAAYRTAVNIHNPQEKEVAFRMKFASSVSGEKPGSITPWKKFVLGPDQAMEIDCANRFIEEFKLGPFVKGFVVIECNVELDIVGVYTTAGRDGEIRTMELERVPVRKLTAGK